MCLFSSSKVRQLTHHLYSHVWGGFRLTLFIDRISFHPEDLSNRLRGSQPASKAQGKVACGWNSHLRADSLCCLQDGVELGVFFREAMEEAGKPFGELTPAQIAAVLRKYETARSHRVAQIIAASTKTGNMFRRAGFLVRASLSVTATVM